MAHRDIVRVQVIFANRAHHDFAGIDADPQIERHSVAQADLIAVTLHVLLHAERGIERPLGMILMGNGRPE